MKKLLLITALSLTMVQANVCSNLANKAFTYLDEGLTYYENEMYREAKSSLNDNMFWAVKAIAECKTENTISSKKLAKTINKTLPEIKNTINDLEKKGY